MDSFKIFCEAVDPHFNYDREGNPDLHAILTYLANEDEDKYPTTVENANVILGSGRTDFFKSLGAAMRAENHPLQSVLEWDNVEKGLEIDKALLLTRVVRGWGTQAQVAYLGSLSPNLIRELLLRPFYDENAWRWSPQEAFKEIKQRIPKLTRKNFNDAVARAIHYQGIFHQDYLARFDQQRYDDQLRMHEHDPEVYTHPDTQTYWNRNLRNKPTKIQPEEFLNLKKHPRKFS